MRVGLGTAPPCKRTTQLAYHQCLRHRATCGQIAGDIAVLTFAIVAFPGAGIGGPARAGNIAKTARAAKTVHASKTLATTARQEKSQSLVA